MGNRVASQDLRLTLVTAPADGLKSQWSQAHSSSHGETAPRSTGSLTRMIVISRSQLAL